MKVGDEIKIKLEKQTRTGTKSAIETMLANVKIGKHYGKYRNSLLEEAYKARKYFININHTSYIHHVDKSPLVLRGPFLSLSRSLSWY